MNSSCHSSSFACPNCGTVNSGTPHQVRRGLKCTSCGTGYIPVKIEPRAFAQNESPLVLIGVVILVVAFAIFFMPIWLDLYLLIAGLLAAILFVLVFKK